MGKNLNWILKLKLSHLQMWGNDFKLFSISSIGYIPTSDINIVRYVLFIKYLSSFDGTPEAF